MFGSVNALFTALAFAGVAFTILLQRDQLVSQETELRESRKLQGKLVEDQINAQSQLFELQKKFQEEQLQKQTAHDVKLEQLRQEFEEIVEGRRKGREEEAERKFKANMLTAIRSELDALSAVYQRASGKLLRDVPSGGFHDARFVVTQHYFSVFETNAVHMGRVEPELSRAILTVYTLLRVLIENFRINNQYLTDYYAIHDQIEQGSSDPKLQKQRACVHKLLVDQAARLKEIDAHVDDARRALYSLMDAQRP